MSSYMNTYLKTPSACTPSESLTITLNYDSILFYTVAELVIDGYDITYNTDTHYTGLTKVKLLTGTATSYNFVLGANALLPNAPDDWTDFGLWGIDATTQAKAKVNFYSVPYIMSSGFTYDIDGYVTNFDNTAEGVIYKISTGTVLLNMLLFSNNPSSFEIENINDSSSSSVDFTFKYINHKCIAGNGGDNIYIYAYELFNSEDELVYKSGDLFNWATSNEEKEIRITGLEDGDYYIKADLGLSNNYILSTTSNTFNVTVNPDIEVSDRITLTNNSVEGRVELVFDGTGLSYNQVTIVRSKWGADEWLELTKINTASTSVTYHDYYAVSNTKYVYRVILNNGDTIVDTFNQIVTHSIVGICIADKYGHYATEAEVSYFPISKNERFTTQNLLNNKYPVASCYSEADYYKGSTSGVFTTVDNECDYNFEDTPENNKFRLEMLDWLNNTQLKFLKFGNGYAFIVVVTGSPSLEQGDTDGTTKVNFEWTEVINKDKLSNYANFGLLG